MRLKTALLSILTGAILSTAGSAHAVVVSNSTFKRTQIAMFSFLETSITCADSTEGTANAVVFISGGEFATHSPGGPTDGGSGTSVSVFSFFNSCTDQSFSAEGFISGGVTGPNQNLTSARLTGSGNVLIDNRDDMPVPVSLNLTFTGNGMLSASRGTTQTRTADGPGGPFTITIQRGAFRNRAADVTGTITIAGVVFAVDVDFGATLLDNVSTTITVTK